MSNCNSDVQHYSSSSPSPNISPQPNVEFHATNICEYFHSPGVELLKSGVTVTGGTQRLIEVLQSERSRDDDDRLHYVAS
ncbi:hypothetical protein J6590_006606 [Homalodisca vitripennis]|nr:hypothetical protein J6590_006606 [Homalodisca vitripennis]